MKITCEYCGNSFNDTEDQCPFCGSPNKGVKRSADKQPKTIEELKKWYEDRGLPPAEVTRFFIGVDYRQPRAFGIYKDEVTGICTVYKNKDTGERAIRYEGTDEAYAVNELLQRLKQEILQQKANSIKKGTGIDGTRSNSGSGATGALNVVGKGAKAIGAIFGSVIAAMLGFGLLAIALMVVVCVGVMVFDNSPNDGYYCYNDTMYYYSSTEYRGEENMDWYSFDTDEGVWTGPYARDSISKDMTKNRKAKKYFEGEEWEQSFPCTNFNDSEFAADIAADFYVPEGYYLYDNANYYHMYSYCDMGWYTYLGDEWTSVDSSSVPDDLTHSAVAEDFYYTPDWDSETQMTDFTTTQTYEDAQTEAESESSWDNDDDSSYDWSSSSDSWDSSSSDWGSDW